MKLVMTPQLQMAIRLLAIPLTELVKELPQLIGEGPVELRGRVVTAPGPFASDPCTEPFPEAFVWREGGELHVVANEVPLPDIVVVGRPMDLSMAPTVEDDEPDPLDGWTPEQREAARPLLWTVRAIRQRGRTYAKVVRALFEAPAKPTLRELAEAVGMHESTMTRVTSGEKVARTEQGLVRLAEMTVTKRRKR